MKNMEKVLRILKWVGFPLGWIMYSVLKDVAGDFWSVAAGTAAAVSFWMIVRKEEEVQFNRELAVVIQTAIRDYNRAYNVVEIKRVRRGAVVRVYMMGLDETLRGAQAAVSQALQEAGLSDRVWVMQMTTIENEEEIPVKREILNKQMIADLSSILKKTRKDKEDR